MSLLSKAGLSQSFLTRNHLKFQVVQVWGHSGCESRPPVRADAVQPPGGAAA